MFKNLLALNTSTPQHRNRISALALLLFSTFAHAAVEIELIPMSFFVVDEVKRAAAGQGCGLIVTQDNIPLVINNPGKYSIAQDLFFTPNGDNQAAITVNAKNVTIEMNDHTLSQINTGNADGVGIRVNGGLDDIVIRNGTIQNFSAVGISVEQGCSEVALSNLLTQSIGYNYSTLLPAGIAISQSRTSEWTADGGTYLGTHSLSDGITISNVTAAQILNKQAGKLFFVGGILAINSQNMIVSDCFINDVLSSGRVVVGVGILTSTNVLVDNCTIANLQAIGLPINVNGFLGSIRVITSSRVTVRDSVIMKNRGSRDPDGMFFSTSDSFAIRDCVVYDPGLFNPSAAETQISAGYEIFRSVKGVVENCQAINVPSGFLLFSPSRDVLFKNCHAIGLAPEVTPTGQTSTGFRSEGPGIIFDSCVAENFHNFTVTPTLPAAGFRIRSINNTVINCEVRDCDFGILEDGAAAARNLIKYNEIYNCVSGVEGSITGSSMYINNIAYMNTATNFQKMPAGTPIRTWTLTAGSPPPAANNFGIATSENQDNLSVV